MKVFVTGSTGYIGRHIVAELLAEGHKVVGLCRTAEQAEGLKKLGVEPLIGDVKDVDTLEKAAREADGVIHLAFDYTNFEAAVENDKKLITAFHRALKGTGKPVVTTSGSLTLGPSEPGKILDDNGDVTADDFKIYTARGDLEKFTLKFAKDGLNISLIRPSTFVYGENGSAFVPLLIQFAKKNGYSPYIGDGSAHLSAIHVKDVAHAYVLVLQKGQAGAGYTGVSENNVTYKQLAEAIGKLVGVEAKSITLEQAQQVFDPFHSWVFSTNHQTSAVRLEKDVGWTPAAKTTILDDITHGSYRA